MKKKRILLFVLIGLLAFALSGAALAKPETGETIDWWVFGGGGGRATAGNISLDATLGQNSIGSSSTGVTQLESGFWYGFQTHTLNLPIVVK